MEALGQKNKYLVFRRQKICCQTDIFFFSLSLVLDFYHQSALSLLDFRRKEAWNGFTGNKRLFNLQKIAHFVHFKIGFPFSPCWVRANGETREWRRRSGANASRLRLHSKCAAELRCRRASAPKQQCACRPHGSGGAIVRSLQGALTRELVLILDAEF